MRCGLTYAQAMRLIIFLLALWFPSLALIAQTAAPELTIDSEMTVPALPPQDIPPAPPADLPPPPPPAASHGDISSSPSTAEIFSQAQAAYIENDFEQAAELFRQAADAGHTDAQYMYALMLHRGQGTARDDQAAGRYYTQAARAGHAKAQYNLAILYYSGEGVARSDTSAYKWLYAAGLQGEPRAIKMLPVAERNLAVEKKDAAVAELAPSGEAKIIK
jgi:hypothetical protein